MTVTAPAPDRVVLGERFAGRFEVRRLLGAGGQKEVYLVHDARLGRDVALSIMSGTAGAARVIREARAMARLGDHPHIVTIFDAGEESGVPFIVARYMSGGSLAMLLAGAPDRRLPIELATRVGMQLADALAYAHERGVLHRDVKPANVWLDADGRAALGDFGLARLPDEEPLTLGAVLGTPLYISPEQARGGPVDHRSDLYSLGVTLFESTCGRPPFTGHDPVAILRQQTEVEPPRASSLNPAIPAPLEQLLDSLLAKAPEARPVSAAEVRDALGAMAGEDVRPTLHPGRHPAGLVGRESPLAMLRGALAAASAGRPRMVALTGEPGIGKTRLAEEVAGVAERAGAAVAWGICAEAPGVPPYWPWRQALDALLERGAEDVPAAARAGVAPLLGTAEPGDDGNPDAARFRLFEAVVMLLRTFAVRRPVVVVLDDIHWADRSSLRLLEHLGRAAGPLRLLVIVAYRSGAAGPLFEALGELARGRGFETVELHGLGKTDVARVVAHTLGRAVTPEVSEAIYARTDGNPFFVRELVRMLAAENRLSEPVGVPSHVQEVVGRRVETLPADAARVLAAAAVVGREFELGLAAAGAGIPRAEALAWLEQAAAGCLVQATPRPGAFRFAHALIRDVVYESLPAGKRAETHAAIAAELRERLDDGDDQDPAELALHYLAAARHGGDPGPAVEFSIAAAQEAMRALAYPEAELHYERALEAAALGGHGDRERRCELFLALGEVKNRLGEFDKAQLRFLRAAKIARRLDAPERFGRAALGYAHTQHYGIVDRIAVELLEEALDRLPGNDGALRAQLLGRLAVRLDPATEQARSVACLDEAIAMARRLGDRGALAWLLTLSASINWSPDRTAARRAAAAESVELARAAGDRPAELWARVLRFVEFLETGEIGTADAELGLYARVVPDSQERWFLWYLMVMRTTRLCFAGELGAARALAEDAVKFNREFEPDAEQEYGVQRLMIARLEGRPERADRDILAGLAETSPRGSLWRALLANLDWALARHDDAARALADAAPDGFGAVPRTRNRLNTLTMLAEVCAGVGAASTAATLYELLEPFGARNAVTDRAWAAWGAIARHLGLLAAAAGRADAAAAHFEEALARNSRWGARPWVVQTVADYATACPWSEAAAALVPDAVAEARALGLQAQADRLELLRGTP